MADSNERNRLYVPPYNRLVFSAKSAILTLGILLAYIGTWLPHFGILNYRSWVGALPFPMAWILSMNVITTLGVVGIYVWYFRPFADRFEVLERNRKS